MDTVVFRPLPYEDPTRLVKVCSTAPRDQGCDDLSLPELLALREQSHVFQGIAADDGTTLALTRADGSKESVGVAFVTIGTTHSSNVTMSSARPPMCELA